MSIFQKAGELASGVVPKVPEMREFCRTIAAMGGAVEVEPVKHADVVLGAAYGGVMARAELVNPLYTADQLATATLQAHEAGRRAGLEDAEKVADGYGMSTCASDIADDIRALIEKE